MSISILGSAAVDELIGRFDDPALIGKGALFVLGFDAIRDRSGGRWAMRQETVREYIERQFQKYFLPTDYLLRLDDVNFLVVQPFESSFGAQARALKLLGDVLQFFLGASAKADVQLSRVVRIELNGVEVAPIEVSDADLTRLANMDWSAMAAATVVREVVDQSAIVGSPGPLMNAIDTAKESSAVTFGRDLSYEAIFFTEPIWSIKQRAVVSYLLRPLIFELQENRLVDANLTAASSNDLMRLNLLVLAEAQRLFREQGAENRFALHVPIHHSALGTATGRQALLATLEHLQPLASSSVVVVLTGLEPGIPHSRIVASTSALNGRCRAVIALAPNLDCRIDRWRDAHLSGVAIDLSALTNANEPLNVRRMSDFAALFQGVAPALMAYSVPNTAVLLAAWSAGFTHVGGELIDRYTEGVLQPLRLNPIDLYRDKL